MRRYFALNCFLTIRSNDYIRYIKTWTRIASIIDINMFVTLLTISTIDVCYYDILLCNFIKFIVPVKLSINQRFIFELRKFLKLFALVLFAKLTTYLVLIESLNTSTNTGKLIYVIPLKTRSRSFYFSPS